MTYYFWMITKDVFAPFKTKRWELCPTLLNENGISIDGEIIFKDWHLLDKEKINLGVKK